MIDVAVVGLGKMGLSHLSMIKAHPDVNLVGVCDATGYLLDILAKYTGVKPYKDLDKMLDEARPQAIIIATPTHLHAGMIRNALERGIHVFCEKPLVIDPADSIELTALAEQKDSSRRSVITTASSVLSARSSACSTSTLSAPSTRPSPRRTAPSC